MNVEITANYGNREQICRRVRPEVTTQLVLALVISRLDYCNSVLASLAQSTNEPLQRVQNASARLIFNLGGHEHVTSCLPHSIILTRFEITKNIFVMTDYTRAGKSPRYLSDIVQPTTVTATRFRSSGLRSLSDTKFA